MWTKGPWAVYWYFYRGGASSGSLRCDELTEEPWKMFLNLSIWEGPGSCHNPASWQLNTACDYARDCLINCMAHLSPYLPSWSIFHLGSISFHCGMSLDVNSIALIHIQLSKLSYSCISFSNLYLLRNVCIYLNCWTYSHKVVSNISLSLSGGDLYHTFILICCLIWFWFASFLVD